MRQILIILLLSTFSFSFSKEENNTFIKYSLTNSYNNIVYSLLDELAVNGFILSYRANISKSLNKTTKFFKEKPIYLNANKIGFCKSTLSLKMMRENQDNILYCPLSLAIYEKNKDEIIILYQKAKVLKENNLVMNEVNKIIDEIIVKSIQNRK